MTHKNTGDTEDHRGHRRTHGTQVAQKSMANTGDAEEHREHWEH